MLAGAAVPSRFPGPLSAASQAKPYTEQLECQGGTYALSSLSSGDGVVAGEHMGARPGPEGTWPQSAAQTSAGWAALGGRESGSDVHPSMFVWFKTGDGAAGDREAGAPWEAMQVSTKTVAL